MAIHDDAIHGSVRDEEGRERPFSGWLGLSLVLTALLEEAGEGGAPGADGPAAA